MQKRGMWCMIRAREAAGESNPEPAPEAAVQTQAVSKAASKALRDSARELSEFKVACDMRLPKLSKEDLVEAIEYATEAYHRTLNFAGDYATEATHTREKYHANIAALNQQLTQALK